MCGSGSQGNVPAGQERISMNIIPTALDGVFVLEPRVFGDARGCFFESWNQRDFDAALAGAGALPAPVRFVQDNESHSVYGVIRGLHFQAPPFAQAKLVRVVSGTVLDVALDIRRGSPTYGQHVAVELSGENHRQMFIPRGFAHGFSVLSPEAVFQYKCDAFYAPEADCGISPQDSALGIDWRIPEDRAILSPKDLRQPLFAGFVSPFGE